MSTCWWCGSEADTREHKWPKAELKMQVSSWPLVLHRGQDGKFRQAQGPDSDLLKWDYSLCAYCNNVRSQPFDRAYMQLITYLMAAEDDICEQGWFLLSEALGEEWQSKALLVIKYLTKHLCCRMVEAGLEPFPEDIVFLDSEVDLSGAPGIGMTFGIRQPYLDAIAAGWPVIPLGFRDFEFRDTPLGRVYKASLYSHWFEVTFEVNWFPSLSMPFRGDRVDLYRREIGVEDFPS